MYAYEYGYIIITEPYIVCRRRKHILPPVLCWFYHAISRFMYNTDVNSVKHTESCLAPQDYLFSASDCVV